MPLILLRYEGFDWRATGTDALAAVFGQFGRLLRRRHRAGLAVGLAPGAGYSQVLAGQWLTLIVVAFVA